MKTAKFSKDLFFQDSVLDVGITLGPKGFVFVGIAQHSPNYESQSKHFTPKQARKIAKALTEAADAAEHEAARG